jgi:hypothetical protein
MWNNFKLLTSLSYNDIITQGSTIGFYPDTPDSFIVTDAVAAQYSNGLNVCNNDVALFSSNASSNSKNIYNQYNVLIGTTGAGQNDVNNFGLGGNSGLTNRIKWINYNSSQGGYIPNTLSYGQLLLQNNMQQIWKSNVVRACTSGADNFATVPALTAGLMQVSVMGIIYLKHIHSFFNMIPLLKGVFMKLTLNLNNATTTATVNNTGYTGYSSNVPVGGVNPLMITSWRSGSYQFDNANFGVGTIIRYNLSIGSTCTDNSLNLPANASTGNISKSVYLYVPAYTFNDDFEKAYLASSPKTITYTDIYQYQVLDIGPAVPFNNLITNGIANLKSILIIPFYTKGYTNVGGALTNYQQWQSPFDSAGCGTTAPMVTLGNFNIQISGQNAIYNTQRYNFEEFVNQLYGQNAVNGGLTDGLTSGLIDFNAFQTSCCFYYVDVSRMLPVEKSVPKSVQITGTNLSTFNINLWVFCEYESSVKVDLYTGARV